MGVSIHATAIVEKGAYLGEDVVVGPYSFVGSKVTLGDRVKILSHGVISGKTSIGSDSTIWPFATLGAEPQDLKYDGEETALICGSHNRFREYCNISIGTESGSGSTVVGSNNLFMINTHIAHDCHVGSHCVFANGVSLGGHVIVGDHVVLGGHSAFHQFTHVGSYSISGGGSVVVQDVLPFAMVQGNHAKPTGVNVVGLMRKDFSRDAIKSIRAMYKLIFRSSLTLDESVKKIEVSIPSSPMKALVLDFIERPNSRGLAR